MKGALEELDEPVDDLMEVSKVQTQILNLTHNQVDIFDKKTQAFRSTYDIIKDVAEVWDSLNSTSQASLTEILFGKNRANIGLALIQAFQSGQVQKAYEDAVNSAGTATTEYEKMMSGIQAHINALKGAVEELSNSIAKSEGINFIIDRGKDIINIINAIVKSCGSLVIAIAPITGFITAKYKISFISMLKEIGASLRGLETNANGATRAMQALKSVGATLGSVIGGIAIGAAISGLAKLVDWLIVTSDELKEIRNEYHDALVDLKNEADELDESKEKLKSLAEEYSKISTTVADVSERKLQLAEIQNDLVTSYGEEADGIDLVNGKYSEQIKKIEELIKKQEEQFRIENAGEISKAQYLKNLRVSESDFTYSARLNGYVPHLKDDVLSYYSFSTPFTASTKDIEKVNEIVDKIDGIYNGAGGEFYLTGSLDEARDTLGKFLNEYRQIDGMNQKFLDNVTELYETLNNSVQKINELEPYLSEPETTTPKINVGKNKVSGSTKTSSQSDTQDIESESDAITSQTTAIKENITVRDVLNATIEETKNSFEKLSTASEKANKENQAFYDKLDEAQAKLLKMSSEDLSIDEYAALLIETNELEAELYKMSSFSSEASGYVTTLFEQFKKGIAESGDGLAEFVAKFENELEGAFKETAELVTGVQDAFEKMADGKGVDNAQAWKLLKADTEGYLQTIQLVNGEYVFAEEELLRFKDAKIKSSVEDIQASNAEAQVSLNNMKNKISAQYALLEAKRKELEINATLMSQQEAAKIFYEESSRIKIEISEMEQAALDWARAIDRNNLLISELEQSYGRVGTMVADIPAYLSNNVSILEKEVSSIENTIDSLNNRKDALEDEKSILQDQLDILNEQKEAIEDTIKQYDTAASAISGYVKSQTKALQEQVDAMKETSEAIKKNYDDQIEELQKQNEERDNAIKKEKALANLQDAQNQKKRVYSSDRGWTYEASQADILEAQNALADIENEQKIKTLEKERDAQLEELDDRQKEYETQIKNFEDYAQKYADIADNIKQAESELVAEQILGSDWRVKIEQLDEELLTKYSNEYTQFNTQLNNLVNNEIKSLQDSIDAKDREIKKIDDEIKAYEKYKSSVETNLKNAKSALEEYEKTMSDVSSNVIQSSSDMENAVWRYFSNIQQWITDTKNVFDEKGQGIADDCDGIIAATVRLRRELQESATGFGIINSAGDASILVGHYANGGVIDQTGLAMVHGSQTSSETAFSAKDSSKLYNFVHETPNIMAAIIKQATRISNTMPTANADNTSNSISVTIGQVVANNPSELTHNLDKHLDSYFRRKLTQSYVQ